MAHLNHVLNGAAAQIPINTSTPTLSFTPVILPSTDRPVDLQLRVTVPSTGSALPVILLAHGHGRSNWLSSLNGYAPIAEFWAAHGFAVIQPTLLSSKFLGLQSDPGQELFWQSRAQDMIHILDQLNAVEAAVPGLQGRLDRDKVAIAGHSLGGWTASMLLGAANTDPRTGETVRMHEPRIKAGVVLAGTGKGGADLSDGGRQRLPFYQADFAQMSTPALVVYGDEEEPAHLSVRDADWHADPYVLAPGPKSLFTVRGAKHGLGGISGWDAAETLDESPERLGAVQRMTWAYLRSQFYEGDKAWEGACEALGKLRELGAVEHKNK